MSTTEEAKRLAEAYDADSSRPWLKWGPYLSERQWGTVREDYSSGGNAWDYFPHDHARSRSYRWGEDGLAGLSDEEQRLCFSIALWNGRDPILKERLFGLTNGEGNHGEDVKEYYFFLDNTPTHSWMTWLYKYPQRPFPYDDLVAENARRKRDDPGAMEYELIDTGVFDEDRYFDVHVTYAKAGPEDICIRIAVTNHGPEEATLEVLPTLWFRNRWSWQHDAARPQLKGVNATATNNVSTIVSTPSDDSESPMTLYCEGASELLFVDNETNASRLWGASESPRYPKDGVNDFVVSNTDTVNRDLSGTKAAARWTLRVAPGATQTIQLRLASTLNLPEPFGARFNAAFEKRQAEADAWWNTITPDGLSSDRRDILRQAYAGMLWSKQYYYYVVRDWLKGDPTQPPPPPGRSRNEKWQHFYASNILTMPDTWEYPWFAAWDLCFQSVVFARIDPHFAKNQLLTLAREFYMSPDGAIPAYEWAFGDVNPPLHAWAALRIFDIEREMHGRADHTFLEAIFSYCLMYFTWWANRKDADDNDLFSGGFLGLDNISIVDRSHLDQLAETIGQPVKLSQSDGTSWMGMFSLNLLEMATRLSHAGHSEYDRLADKFLQHFVFISDAINGTSEKDGQKIDIWDETDGFYYDVLKVGNGDQARYLPVKLRSLVGVIALFPCMVFNVDELKAPLARGLNARLDWFEERHPELLDRALVKKEENGKQQRLLSFVHPSRLCRILSRVLDEAEMLGAHGIRGLSKAHLNPPYRLDVNGTVLTERYEPAESAEGLFGGNSNWRGPVWFPINFLLIESLLRYHTFLGDEFTVEYPTGSGRQATLREVADGLTDRLVAIFERDANQRRPVFGGNETFQTDPKWGDHILFYEYFHGDNGAGIGASHQTGWTGLVAELLHGIGTESSIPNTQNKTRSRSTTQLAALAFMRGLLR